MDTIVEAAALLGEAVDVCVAVVVVGSIGITASEVTEDTATDESSPLLEVTTNEEGMGMETVDPERVLRLGRGVVTRSWLLVRFSLHVAAYGGNGLLAYLDSIGVAVGGSVTTAGTVVLSRGYLCTV